MTDPVSAGRASATDGVDETYVKLPRGGDQYIALSMARKGTHCGAKTDLLKTQCRCQRTWGSVTPSDIPREVTFSCGTKVCTSIVSEQKSIVSSSVHS